MFAPATRSYPRPYSSAASADTFVERYVEASCTSTLIREIPSIVIPDEAHVDESIDRLLNTPGSCLAIVNVHPDVTTND